MALNDNLFWRRLHSFAGAAPLGGFLVFHLYENSYAILSPSTYDEHVRALRSLPYLHVMEVSLIFTPLAFHSLYGLYVWYTGKNNFPLQPYARNGLYLMQRLTGLVALVFICYHIYDQRLQPMPSFSSVATSVSDKAVLLLYAVGIAACALHLFNGLWNALVKWGVTIGARSQQAALAGCSLLGVGLVVVGLRALKAFM